MIIFGVLMHGVAIDNIAAMVFAAFTNKVKKLLWRKLLNRTERCSRSVRPSS